MNKRKRFDVEPPTMTESEDRSFERVLRRMRDTGTGSATNPEVGDHTKQGVGDHIEAKSGDHAGDHVGDHNENVSVSHIATGTGDSSPVNVVSRSGPVRPSQLGDELVSHNRPLVGDHIEQEVGVANQKELVSTTSHSGDKSPTQQNLVGEKSPTLQKVGDHIEQKPEKGNKGNPDRHKQTVRRRVQTRVQRETFRRLTVNRAKQEVGQEEFLERALLFYMDHLEGVGDHTGCVVGEKSPHDDLMIWRTSEDIIKLYMELTGNRWKPADDLVGIQFNKENPKAVMLGMVHTIYNARGKKINSFKYFKSEIEYRIDELKAVDNLNDEHLDAMIKRAKKAIQERKWEKK